ncbi:MAG: hypothetical protein PUP90_14035 [Nostoc sp. S4]|nr:hypothetical protein [Nostoc sp. S4]
MHRQGDVGASLRETMKAMALFGLPPEEYWPYEEDKFDEESETKTSVQKYKQPH